MTSTNHSKAFLLCFVLLSRVGYYGDAFPTGAGSCPGQQTAVMGSHVSPDKSLTEIVGFDTASGLSVTVDGVDVTNQDLITMPANQDIELTVTSSKTPIRGVLMRLIREDGVDATGAILPADPTALQDASMVCMTPAAGVTQVDNTDKTAVSAILRFDEPVVATLDVTLVFENSEVVSSYAFDSFTLNFSDDQVTMDRETMAPAAAPLVTTAPVTAMLQSMAPTAVVPETQSPVTTRIIATGTPVMTIPDTILDIDETSNAPSFAPTNMISDRPSGIPLTGSTDVPIGAPTVTDIAPVVVPPMSASPESVGGLTPSDCASLDKCFLENLKTEETVVLSVDNSTSYGVRDGDRYTVFCETAGDGTTNAVDFIYNNETHTEWKNIWYMGGNGKDWVNNVDYLTTDCGSVKTFEVVGRVWRGECFRVEFVLESVCVQNGS